MGNHHKLSLPAAIFININIMMGSGVFINTIELARRAGILGGFLYLALALLLLPLIASIATLVNLHPSGGFYMFGSQEISPLFGFISSWSYFIGKLASTALTLHVAMTLLQQIFPVLASINILTLDLFILALFIFLNTLNLQTGKQIQYIFIIMKAIPILFAILGSLYLVSTATIITGMPPVWSGMAVSLPLVLYASTGFEAACSLSSRIKNAKRNAPIAIYTSFIIVLFLSFIYQFIFSLAIGIPLGLFDSYLQAFPSLLIRLFTNKFVMQKLLGLIYIAIACSSLGAGYGLIFSNNWNLYTLATHNHTFFKNFLTKFNSHHIPVACIFVEGAFVILYFAITKGAQLPLQQLGALGATIAYSISVLSLLFAKYKKPEIPIGWFIPILGLGNCIILTVSCISSFFVSGLFPLIVFSILLLLGVGMYFTTKSMNQSAQL